MNLSIPLPGILAKVYVEEGQWFEKGQLLAELINDDLIVRVDIATHELTQAEVRLELLALGSRKEEIDEARAQVEGLNAQRAYLTNVKRMRERLFARRAASQEEVLEIQSCADVNTKDVEAATARWERLKVGPPQQEIAGAQAAVRVALRGFARRRSPTNGAGSKHPARGASCGYIAGKEKAFQAPIRPPFWSRPTRASSQFAPRSTRARRNWSAKDFRPLYPFPDMRALPRPGRSDASPTPWAER